MLEDRDLYGALYTAKLRRLLPGVLREDGGTALSELVDRLGGEIAAARRRIDRSYADQSVETSDDWLVPYHADLLAVDLVAGLDVAGQRQEVARAIYYRRRKGTVALLEELAADLTGWNARVVEFFRRLARTRHGFDPPIGVDRDLAVLQGLVGARSGTPAGGFADLRHAAAAGDSRTAFDEFAHHADFRRGRDDGGWHAIPRLGVFLWRLHSLEVRSGSPVARTGCPEEFTHDPTGRDIPLFAQDHRDHAQYGDAWVTPDQWMLPGPIDRALLDRERARLEPASFATLRVSGPLSDPLPAADTHVDPERGRVRLLTALPQGAQPQVTYHYGIAGLIGAGPYDRRALGLATTGAAPITTVSGGGDAFATAAPPATGTIVFDDSLTYTSLPPLDAVQDLTLRGGERERPVLRPTVGADAWIVTGTAPDARLTIEGVLLSGVDIVVRGEFAEIAIVATTLDPGQTVDVSGIMPRAIDDRPLTPTTIWIEGQVASLRLARAITGPIRVRGAGRLLAIAASTSIIQGVRSRADGPFDDAALFDAQALARRWRLGQDALTEHLRTGFPAPLVAALDAHDPQDEPSAALRSDMIATLEAVATGPALYDPVLFAATPLPPAIVAAALRGEPVNRRLLEFAYPLALAPAAIAGDDVRADLNRTTVLGAVFAHRLSASETILADFVRVTDMQNGCIRFSAYPLESRLARPFESVTLTTGAPLFVSRRFGDPGYAQLCDDTDPAIAMGGIGQIEMGAFAEGRAALKRRGLLRKLTSFAPVGTTIVPITVT